MKNLNFFKAFMMLVAMFVISSSMIMAQEKPENTQQATKMEKHVCKDACKDGCKSMSGMKAEGEKHVCTDKCKDGCTAMSGMKSDDTKHVCTDACKDGCTAMKGMDSKGGSKAAMADTNKDGFVYQCPMTCTDKLTDEAGTCEKCGMDTKKVTLEEAEKHLHE